MNYDEEALQAVRELRLLIHRYDAWLVKTFQDYLGQRILEIGCGLGNLFPHIGQRELLLGVDVSEESITKVQKKYAHESNVEARVADITNPQALQLSEFRFDTAISLNVFEHIEDDEQAIAHTARILAPGGCFILIVPAHRQLFGPMDKSIGHYRRYTKASSKRKMEQGGFQVVHQRYINMLGALGWFFSGRILRKTVPPDNQLRLLNILIPFVETIESQFPAPFGVSVLTVGRTSTS